GLFDVPTFITSIKDNKKLRGKTAFYIKIYVKLMDVWCSPKYIGLEFITQITTFNYIKNT
ncbi:hypothetical protein ACTFQL_27955, partial [Bacillus cereus group sp. MYBK44-1]